MVNRLVDDNAATGAFNAPPSRSSFSSRYFRTKSFLKISFYTTKVAALHRSWQPSAELLRCISYLQGWTHELVPLHFYLSSGGPCEFWMCKRASRHYFQSGLCLQPFLHLGHLPEALLQYSRLYCQKASAHLTYRHFAWEIPTCLHSLRSNVDQINLIKFNVTGSFLKYTKLSPAVHDMKNNMVTEQNFLPHSCLLNVIP